MAQFISKFINGIKKIFGHLISKFINGIKKFFGHQENKLSLGNHKLIPIKEKVGSSIPFTFSCKTWRKRKNRLQMAKESRRKNRYQ